MLKEKKIIVCCCLFFIYPIAQHATSKNKTIAHEALDTTLSFTRLVPTNEEPLHARVSAKKKRSSPPPERSEEHITPKDSEKDIFQWFQTYAEVVSLVQQKGFKSVDFSKFIQKSLKSAVASIDAHSNFFDQDSYKAALEETSGAFSGIGVSIMGKNPDDDALLIVDVIQHGPGAKAGLKSGDKIVEVNHEKLRGLSSDEATNKLKGKVGSDVFLKIIRDKKPLEFTVTRQMIKDQKSSCYYFKDQQVYYLSLSIFTETAAQQMTKLLKKANDGDCKGIILDLRRNPGGTLDSAIEMAGLFLPKGSLVASTRNSKRQTVEQYHTKHDPLLQSDVPIFVLVNNFTASAAEILAGCLAHHSREGVKIFETQGKKQIPHNLMVFLVGTPTFGKGSVQELIPIKNGCALKLTTMLYFLPQNISIQASGIKPDFTVHPKLVPFEQLKWVDDFYGKESSLKNHITADEVQSTCKEHDKTNNTVEPIQKNHEIQTSSKGMTQGIRRSGAASTLKKDQPAKSHEEQRQEDLALDVQVQACVNMISLYSLAKTHTPDRVGTRQKAFDFLKTHYITDQPAAIEKVS